MSARRRWWSLVGIVLRKEVTDHLRDKRSMILSLLFPLMAPALIGVLISVVASANIEGINTRLIVAHVAGAGHAPELMAYLKAHDVTIEPLADVESDEARNELRRRVKNGELAFVLVIPEEAKGAEVYGIDLLTDRTNPRSMADTGEIMRHLTEYSRGEARRIVERAGLEASAIVPVTVEEINVGRAPNQAYLFYNMIPSLVMFMVFMGAVYLAIDTSVGERERGSLEPLLSAPVARWELLLGKALAAYLFTALIVSVNLTAFHFSISAALEGTEGMAAPPSPLTYATIFALAVPLMAFAVSVQMTIAALTRSAKEAQIYLGLLPTLPLIPGLFLVFNPSPPGWGAALVPVFGQLRLFMELTSGRALPEMAVAGSTVVTLVAAGLTFWLASRLFERERMVFGS